LGKSYKGPMGGQYFGEKREGGVKSATPSRLN